MDTFYKNPPVFMSYICQLKTLHGKGVGLTDVCRWLNCTKPTASKIMTSYVDAGYLYRVSEAWRPNTSIHWYKPVKKAVEAYEKGEYRDAYLLHMMSMMKRD